ncbi:MAG: hypothetical protein AAF513_07000, partial [Pseudomonadota bacterium]
VVETGQTAEVSLSVVEKYPYDASMVGRSYAIDRLVIGAEPLRAALQDVGRWADRILEEDVNEHLEIRPVAGDRLRFDLTSPPRSADSKRGVALLTFKATNTRSEFSTEFLVDPSGLDLFGQAAQRMQ